jgi:hypothetical protein
MILLMATRGPKRPVETWGIVLLSSPEVASALRTKLDAGFRIRAKGSREGWPIPMLPRPVLYAATRLSPTRTPAGRS